MVHQPITLDAIVVVNVTIVAGVMGTVGGALVRCLPPTPNMIMKVRTLGIHAMLSYLWVINNEKSTIG